jgi:hypothetical protein
MDYALNCRFGKQVSLKAPTDTRPLVDYIMGRAYRLYSLTSS